MTTKKVANPSQATLLIKLCCPPETGFVLLFVLPKHQHCGLVIPEWRIVQIRVIRIAAEEEIWIHEKAFG